MLGVSVAHEWNSNNNEMSKISLFPVLQSEPLHMGMQITTASPEGNSVHKQNTFYATAKSPETSETPGG